MIVPLNLHSSQFPEQLHEELLASLRTRRVNHKFHYESRQQAQKWLALHQRYSPSRNDLGCRAIYEEAFAVTAETVKSPAAHVIGLGCGGGSKDFMLLQQLRKKGRMLVYSACDVSHALVLAARHQALTMLDGRHVHDLVADLMTADDLQRIFSTQTAGNSTRIINFLGMVPNFEPAECLARLSSLLRPNDMLILSANLAPGDAYRAGVEQVLPQYDNAPTRDWLMTFLTDLGVESRDGKLSFALETDEAGLNLLRVVAWFEFAKERVIQLGDERFAFKPGERLRVFFSYRHTPKMVRDWLGGANIEVLAERVAHFGEEGVFVCRKTR